MDDNVLVIKFGGDGNIKVETLTEFLDLYKDLIYLINTQLGYSIDDLIIEVSPPENGSFKIKIKPKYKKLLLRSLEVIVTGTVSGLLVYYLTAKPDEPTKEDIEAVLNRSEIRNPDIHKNVFNVFQNTGASQTIHQTFVIVNSDDNVRDLKISQNDKEIINVNKHQIAQLAERNEMEASLVEEPPKQDILRDEAVLVVKTIHFEGHAKWVFVFRGYPIKAVIKDEAFLGKLGDEAFRKGDQLKVLLARKRTFDEDLQTYIVDQNSYVVEEVIEHISKKKIQNRLDFD
jgi:hypothetical protein